MYIIYIYIYDYILYIYTHTHFPKKRKETCEISRTPKQSKTCLDVLHHFILDSRPIENHSFVDEMSREAWWAAILVAFASCSIVLLKIFSDHAVGRARNFGTYLCRNQAYQPQMLVIIVFTNITLIPPSDDFPGGISTEGLQFLHPFLWPIRPQWPAFGKIGTTERSSRRQRLIHRHCL